MLEGLFFKHLLDMLDDHFWVLGLVSWSGGKVEGLTNCGLVFYPSRYYDV